MNLQKKKVKKDETSLKYYYDSFMEHGSFSVGSPYCVKAICVASIVELLFVAGAILFYINPPFLELLYGEYIWLKNIYFVMLFYFALVIGSMIIYHMMSLSYEKHYKHQLLQENSHGIYRFMILNVYVVNFPWIFTSWFSAKVFKILNLSTIREMMSFVVSGYCISFVVGLWMGKTLWNLIVYINDKYITLTNQYVTAKTWLYLVIGVVVLSCKKITVYILKKMIRIFKSNKNYEKKIFDEYNLMNFYFLSIISLVLLSLDFDEPIKIFVDAFFYSTTAMSILAQARSKMQ